MRRTAIRRADGRELLYHDGDDAPSRVARDRRDLPPSEAPIEMRRDPLLDAWVVVASHRQERTHLPAAADCPLCPSQPGRETEIPEDDLRSTSRSGTSWPRSSSTSSAASTRSSTRRCRTSPPGTRRPCTRAATSPTCTCSSSRCGRPRRS